jgi:fructose-1,6-bisphosphatase/inositol monophosphatase family enzyme
MTTVVRYGNLDAHAIGIIMKDAVGRAIDLIRGELFSLEVMEKQGYGDKKLDVFTSADRAAQVLYQKILRERFPTFGIIGEEDALRIPCTHEGVLLYFTVDPLDGTKAAIRKQSHGIGTMLALVHDVEVIAVAIADVTTKEIFYYHPESPKVLRLVAHTKGEIELPLEANTQKPLNKRMILLRDHPEKFSAGAQRFIRLPKNGGVFKDILIDNGSIGVSMARMWNNEAGAYLLLPGYDTPWDFCPVLGMCKKLGFEFLEIDPSTGSLSLTDPKPSQETLDRKRETLVVHRDYLPDLGL